MTPPALPARAQRKTYDEAYFRRWYHDPRTRIHSPESVRRKVRMVVGVAEYFLGHKVRSVLDIGAGEGQWRSALRRLRPGIRYVGVDPSEYVVRRCGKRRNIRLGDFGGLRALRLGKGFDLIICVDMLQYVDDARLVPGIRHLTTLLSGLAYLESFTIGDEMEGDFEGWHPRSREEYRRIYADAGLVSCGLHCHITPALAERAVELELS